MLGMGGAGAIAVAANQAFAMPFRMRQGQKIVRLGFGVSIPAAAFARVAIYSNKSALDPYPGNLLLETVALSTNGAGFQLDTVDYTVLSTALYWAVINSDATGGATIRGVNGSNDIQESPLGMTSAFSQIKMIRGLVTYANPWPDPYAATGDTMVTANCPVAIMQLSDT
jgi:hypothetical protein